MEDTSVHNEKELLSRISEGEEEAFALLIRNQWKNIYSHAIAWLKSAELAEELTQDIFLKVWNSRDQLPELDNFNNWLFIISRNSIVSAVRKKLQQPSFLQTQEKEEHAIRPDYMLERRQHYQVLLEGIEQLPDKRKQVFRMSRIEGFTHEQIAEKLGIHKDTVAQYIVKAVSFLKTYLHERLGDQLLVIILLGGYY